MEHMIAHSPEEVIWKWSLPVSDTYRLGVPKGTRFLPYAEIDVEGNVSIWGIVHTAQIENTMVRRFHMRGTGMAFNQMVGAGYLATATVETPGGQYVLHLFVDPGEDPVAGEGEL